ncbi:ABC transporter ATP-binding protein [Stappia sp. ES.058]|uniref:ABC transporter ATP-binding protein n=1 Tax=Stappia sp. ES.058 TaxID=1881061 RepID=UPI00087DA1B3|nr:ABC transporter ATP-binding protein [Stappia sp. ES.058]SDT90808.1 carbohydrate ABC transporter ATP-binding protein, CUT1 family [Stappia sp. ES.058]
MADVRLTQIKKSFGQVEVLHGITLDIASGEFISLLGASGCGKTTLLRIVAGLEGVTSGAVEIAGRDVTQLPPEKRDISMMFQSYALLPHLSVSENVRFPLRMRKIGSREEQAEKVRDALETVQLGHLAGRKPTQLSGGQQQRVALARAIVSRPQVLLLDEPLSNLDARLREDMQVELIEIHKRLGLTSIFVTHDQEEALSLSDRVVLLNGGKVEQEGAPSEIYSNPVTGFASNFLGAANLLPATLSKTSDGRAATLEDGQVIPIETGAGESGDVTLAMRQEDMTLCAEGEGELAGTVAARIYLGARNRYVVKVAGHEVRVLTGTEDVFESGARVGLGIDPARVRVLPRD